MPDPLAGFAAQVGRLYLRREAARRSHVVAELTALSLLIERGIAMHEEVIERLKLV